MRVTFQREILTQALLAEMIPLLKLHHEQISFFKELPLDPDYERYLHAEHTGYIRTYTVRNEEQALIGYCVFFFFPSLHNKTSKQAKQDVFYLLPEYRRQGIGKRFIEFCDGQLKEENCDAVFRHVTREVNYGGILQVLGYEAVETTYARKL